MSSASLKILKRLYENCFDLESFIRLFIYCTGHNLHQTFAPSYKDFLSNIFVTFPSNVMHNFPKKLKDGNPEPIANAFVAYYTTNQNRFNSITRNSDIFTNEIFPMLIRDQPQIALKEPTSLIFSIENWDTLCAHIGNSWLNFIFLHCSIFISFPECCLLQVVGLPAVDDSHVEGKRKLDVDQTNAKRLKTCRNAEPVVNFHGVKLTVALENLIYSKHLVPSFPTHRGMSRCRETSAAHKLIEDIFSNDKVQLKAASGENYKLTDSTIALLLEDNAILSNAMQNFLANHRRTHYLKMCQAHCLFDEHAEPNVTNYCSSDQIRSFMAAVIYRVIPIQLFGSKHNKCKMQTFCNTFIGASKGDRLSLEHLMHGMRIQDCAWIPGEMAEDQRQIAFALLMNWLFSNFLMDVVTGYFHITDIEGQKKRLFFYPKAVWKKIQVAFMKQLVENGTFGLESLNPYETSKLNRLFGEYACLAEARLFPKKSSMRLILYCKHPASQLVKLKNYLCALNLIAKCSDLRGCSIANLSQFHSMWQHFVNANRTGGTLVCSKPLYFVKLDIQNCFSSIKLDVLERALRRMCTVAENRGLGEVDVRYYFTYTVVNGQLAHDYKHVATPKYGGLLTPLKEAGHANKVLVCLNRSTRISVPEMAANLMAHLNNIYVKHSDNYYRMMRGLGQGNILSPILSTLYFAHMENERLSQFVSRDLEKEMTVRCVDDYFHINSEKQKALEFSSSMHPGIPEYNCETSCRKAEANFDGENNPAKPGHWCAQKKDLIPWLGMVFDTKTGEVMCDYSQYADRSMAHTMTLDASLGKEGLKRKLMFLTVPENNPILFDGKVNGKKTIIKSVYKFCLLNAFRMHSLSTKLSKSEGADKHPDFYYNMIMTCITRIVNSLCKLKRRGIISYPLRFQVTKWICLQAFAAKLNCNSMKYHQVLKRLDEKIAEFSHKIGKNGIRYLRCVIQCKLPGVFKKILV